MSTWEYCQLVTWAEFAREDPSIANSPWKEPIWKSLVRQVGVTEEILEDVSMVEKLNKLGAEGWEVVSERTIEFAGFNDHIRSYEKYVSSITTLLKREL